jgi:hypothetical protein
VKFNFLRTFFIILQSISANLARFYLITLKGRTFCRV